MQLPSNGGSIANWSGLRHRNGAPDRDQGIRSDTTMDKLAVLRTPFKPDGRITAGTASQISDGSGALLLASESAIERYASSHERE
jgi:acetyl-CoA acetyltransferase